MNRVGALLRLSALSGRSDPRLVFPTPITMSFAIPTRTVYVGNIPYSSTEESLRQAFSEYEPTYVKIVEGKGVAFIDVPAKRAFAMIRDIDGSKLEGRLLSVSIARPRENEPTLNQDDFRDRRDRESGFRDRPGGPRDDRPGRPPFRRDDRPQRPYGDRPPRPEGGRPNRPYGDRPPRPQGHRPWGGPRPDDRPPFRGRGPGRSDERGPGGPRPAGRPTGDRPWQPKEDRPPYRGPRRSEGPRGPRPGESSGPPSEGRPKRDYTPKQFKPGGKPHGNKPFRPKRRD